MTPAISVLIPIYNAGKYLPQCLHSLQSQTFADFEIICIDDGSADQSLKILQKAAEEDARIRCFSQSNKGVAATRNRLLSLARGEYVAFVDADDLVTESYLEKLYTVACRTGADLTKCLFNEAEEDGTVRKQTHCHSSFYKVPSAELGARFWAGYQDAVLWGKLFKRKWAEENKFAFWPGRVAEDFPFVVLAFMYARQIALVSERLYIYRKDVAGAITSNALNMAKGILLNLLALRQELIQRGKWDKAVLNQWMRTIVWAICRFRKFTVCIRQQNIDLLREAWHVFLENIPYCRGWSWLRWQTLAVLVKVCGMGSIYFWSKIFR